ncbi:DNA-processing protein DprA [Robiginitalea sediminis]|uniref:DNA-processing protein DprA n=1 Tax=Robiginitalea sediminis TaxID=1982593 RepID=UPI0013037254|nr:DNA-processing protein DprA [Robiginitalea sediminis]
MQFIPGLGPVRARTLIALTGSPKAVFADKALPKGFQLPATLREHLYNPQYLERALRERDAMDKLGISGLPYTSPAYPQLLLECADYPLLLFSQGRIGFNAGGTALSVVGTRRMTAYGRMVCDSFISGLAPMDVQIISGFAYGVDICAHLKAAALGLETVACVAHGLDRVYPRAHQRYKDQILERGGFLSEFPMGTLPHPGLFRRRNRVIAGLTPATLVVESPEKGGSLITADLAFGYDRQVFAVPGRAGDPMSAGCNALVRSQKAELVTCPQQLAAAMQWTDARASTAPKPKTAKAFSFTEKEEKVWEVLSSGSPLHLDEIAIQCGLAISEAARVLFSMEWKGAVRAYPGNRFGKQA